jgi:hypothetical protein
MIPASPHGTNPPFVYYGTENWDRARKKHPGVNGPDLWKILEDQWNAMTPGEQLPSEKERAAWNQKYLLRQDLSMHRMWPDPEGQNPPFSYYGTEKRDETREENPHIYNFAELKKLLEGQWNALTPEEQTLIKKGWRRTKVAFIRWPWLRAGPARVVPHTLLRHCQIVHAQSRLLRLNGRRGIGARALTSV